MTTCKDHKSLIVDVAGGAAGEGDRLRLENHMATCAECAREFEELTKLLALTHGAPVDPGDAYWSGYYGKLMQRIDTDSSPARRHVAPGILERLAALVTMPRWALQLAIALVLVATGVVLGRGLFAPATDTDRAAIVESEDPLRQASLETRAHAYLDRSKTLLLGLVNFDSQVDDPAQLNLDRRRQIADDLVVQAGLLREELSQSDQQRLSELIADLEVILLQIANIETVYDVPEIEMVQSGVDRNAILFKIEVEEMRRLNDAVTAHQSQSTNSAV